MILKIKVVVICSENTIKYSIKLNTGENYTVSKCLCNFVSIIQLHGKYIILKNKKHCWKQKFQTMLI